MRIERSRTVDAHACPPLSPNSRHQPPRHPTGIGGVAVQLALQHAILIEHTIDKEWQHHGGEECSGKPGAEPDPARSDNHEAGAVTGVSDERVWPASDNVLPA